MMVGVRACCRIERVATIVLSLLLVTISLAKLLSGYKENYEIGRLEYHALTVLELGMGGLLLTSMRRAAAWVTLTSAVVGIGITMFTHGLRRCGCLGEWMSLSTRERLLLLGAIGLLASCVAWPRPCVTRTERRSADGSGV